MKDEIKEILDEMYHIICTYSDDFDYFEENKINFELSYKNMEKLYDHITNLQQKYENSQITLAGEWKKRLEIEKNNKHLDNQITMLKQQNNTITEIGLDYKSRCEKAIARVKEGIFSDEGVRCVEDSGELLNILEGSDKE